MTVRPLQPAWRFSRNGLSEKPGAGSPIGDLSNTEKVLLGLDLRPRS
jgi:hypothetical protein